MVSPAKLLIFSLAAAIFLSTKAQATQDWERDCGVVLGDIQLSQTQPLPDASPLRQHGKGQPFTLPPGFEHATGIYCTRSTSVPFDSDYDVVLAGYAVYVYSDNYRWTGSQRYKDAEDILSVLELVDGKFKFRILEGKIDYTWNQYIREQLEKFNFALEKSQPRN